MEENRKDSVSEIDQIFSNAVVEESVRHQKRMLEQQQLAAPTKGKRTLMLAICAALIVTVCVGTGIYVSKRKGFSGHDSSSTGHLTHTDSDNYVLYLKNNALWYEDIDNCHPMLISEPYFDVTQHDASLPQSSTSSVAFLQGKKELSGDLQRWIAVSPDKSGIFYPLSLGNTAKTDAEKSFAQAQSLTLMYRSLLDLNAPPVRVAENVLYYVVLPDCSGVAYLCPNENSAEGAWQTDNVLYRWDLATQSTARIVSGLDTTFAISLDCKRLRYLHAEADLFVLMDFLPEPIDGAPDTRKKICCNRSAYVKDFELTFWQTTVGRGLDAGFEQFYDMDENLCTPAEKYPDGRVIWVRQRFEDDYPTVYFDADAARNMIPLASNADGSRSYYTVYEPISYSPVDTSTATDSELGRELVSIEDQGGENISASRFFTDDMQQTDDEMSRDDPRYTTERVMRNRVRDALSTVYLENDISKLPIYYHDHGEQTMILENGHQLEMLVDENVLHGVFYAYKGEVEKRTISELADILQELDVTGTEEIAAVMRYTFDYLMNYHRVFFVTQNEQVHQLDTSGLSRYITWNAFFDSEYEWLVVQPIRADIPLCFDDVVAVLHRLYGIDWSEPDSYGSEFVFSDWGKEAMMPSFSDTVQELKGQMSLAGYQMQMICDEKGWKTEIYYHDNYLDSIYLDGGKNFFSGFDHSEHTLIYGLSQGSMQGYLLRTIQNGILNDVNDHVQIHAVSIGGVFYLTDCGDTSCGQMRYLSNDGVDMLLDTNVEVLWSDSIEDMLWSGVYESNLKPCTELGYTEHMKGGYQPFVRTILVQNAQSD